MSRVAANQKVRNVWLGVFCMFVFMALVRIRAQMDRRACLPLPVDDYIQRELAGLCPGDSSLSAASADPGGDASWCGQPGQLTQDDLFYLQVQALLTAGYAAVEQMYGIDREEYERRKEHSRAACLTPFLPMTGQWLPSGARLDSS